ncbi:hypothetical protein ACN930_004863 [Vibrio parahaemolyticus]|uniref:hypothetical protein n=1 Tax=Vibrio harveyi group TaxID=717610 RepID=UPI0015DECCDE|nr:MULTISPECIES: hypothetical protein [Vibrio harveyi group]EIO4088945.1 hypothetical protein [Vibrio parahaemolyticus]MDF4264861.1 hypothetical protein [Vibrio parahaemolyticus]HCH2130776.1 hypothetical protein [Vibrio parahaemolyticus]
MTMMLLRIYWFPAFMALGSILSAYVLKIYIPSNFSSSPMLKGLSIMSENAAPWVSLGFLSLAILAFLYQTYSLWQWTQGKGNCCPNCGGMVSYQDGRYGPYFKCLHCGKNTSI